MSAYGPEAAIHSDHFDLRKAAIHHRDQLISSDEAVVKTALQGTAKNGGTMSGSTEAASWADFERIGLRAGTIRRVEPFPEARNPAYKLWIDFGSFGTKQSSAQLTALYSAEALLGRQVICATGLGTKRVAGFKSEVLVTGITRDDGAVVLAALERPVNDGSPLG
jgi:tRNA-binding protein